MMKTMLGLVLGLTIMTTETIGDFGSVIVPRGTICDAQYITRDGFIGAVCTKGLTGIGVVFNVLVHLTKDQIQATN